MDCGYLLKKIAETMSPVSEIGVGKGWIFDDRNHPLSLSTILGLQFSLTKAKSRE